MGTKECIMCYEHIDARARKCHHCSAPQAKWANIEGSPWAMGVVGLFMLAVVANLLFSVLWQPQFKDHARELSVSVARLDFGHSNGDQTLSCFGSISNTSKYDWRNFEFEARLYGPNNDFVDTFTASQAALLVPAGSQTAFRVHGAAALPESGYRRCEVSIKYAAVVR